MAVKMLYRGPSSRLENLIEKIQATKEIGATGKLLHNTYFFICTYTYIYICIRSKYNESSNRDTMTSGNLL